MSLSNRKHVELRTVCTDGVADSVPLPTVRMWTGSYSPISCAAQGTETICFTAPTGFCKGWTQSEV